MHAIFADCIQDSNAPPPTLRLLGQFTVEPSGLAPHGRKTRALLARLVLSEGPLGRDRLSALLWSRRADPQAHASLRQCLAELKSWTRASPPLIRADRDTIAIDHGCVADDLSLLHAACSADDPDAALRWLPDEDVGLLADLDGVDEAWDDWLTAERARQSEAIVREVLAMAERQLDSGELDAALAIADRVTRFDPYSEHAARLVMHARWHAGDSDGVRHAWQRIEVALARGLDGVPSSETASLYRGLMAKRPAPGLISTVAPTPAPMASAAQSERPRSRRLALAAVLTVATTSLAGADSLRDPSAAAADATPVVRIEPVVSRGSGALEERFADALAGDFVRLANVSGGAVRVLDGRAPDKGGDFIVRVAIDRNAASLVSDSRVVDALSGSILWSSRLTEAADGIARLRERTAVSVAGMLDCALSLNGRDRARTVDADRRALVFAICDAENRDDIAREIGLLEQMRQRWPRDSAALGQLAMARTQYMFDADGPADQERRRQRAIQAAQNALAVDAANVVALVALSQTSKGELYMVDGLPMIDKALAIDPGFPLALMSNATGLFQAGFVEASVDPAMRAARADPTSIYKALAVVRRLAAAGQLKEASDRLAEAAAIWPSHPDLAEHRRRLAIEQGQAQAAAVYGATRSDDRYSFEMVLLHQFADPAGDHRGLDAVAEEEFAQFPASAYQLAAHFTRMGDMAKALAWLNRAPVRDTDGQWSLLYWPSVAPLRRDPRFFAKMARLGLVDYWRRHDRWPDFCREPGLQYDCRREAARLAAAGRPVSGGSGASL